MRDSHDDPLRPHAHEPNPAPPPGTTDILFTDPAGMQRLLTVAALENLPQARESNCYIVSTGHGVSGPFTFSGPALLTLLADQGVDTQAWREIEVISADGFGTRITAAEFAALSAAGTILLALQVDGEPMTRAQGLVRLVVPGERDDALRQVKWVAAINVVGEAEHAG